MSRHAVIKLQLTAFVGGVRFDDVVQYTASFAMNSIPTASIMVAVGRNVRTGQLATIHRAIRDLKVQLPVQIYLKPLFASVEQADPGMPGFSIDDDSNGFKIFEGRVVGTGWRRTEGSANFIIHMLHWLGDLNYSSAASASSHPGNPANLTYPAIFRSIDSASSSPDAGNASGPGGWTPASADHVTAGGLSDIWGEILHTWMTRLASDDPIDAAMSNGTGAGDPDVMAALERIGPNNEGKPLKLQLQPREDGEGFAVDDAELEFLAAGMQQALLSESGGSWINTTLWGKLVGEWAPSYWFSVIPRVDDALIVPFTGGLQGEPWAVIGAEDYAQADLNAQMHQVLRGVGIAYPIMFAAGSDLGLGTRPIDAGGLAGFYNPQDLRTGMILMKDAPKWLSDPILPYLDAPGAEGIDGGTINTVMDSTEDAEADTEARDMNAAAQARENLISLYCRQWYVLESLKGRVGEVSGKLRFDIAPGSNVLIHAAGARNVQAASQIQEDIYATVTQVSYVINAESQKAGTAFSLAHIRSASENTSPSTSIPYPPLYEEAWPGAKLVNDERVTPEGEFEN